MAKIRVETRLVGCGGGAGVRGGSLSQHIPGTKVMSMAMASWTLFRQMRSVGMFCFSLSTMAVSCKCCYGMLQFLLDSEV